MEPNIFTDSVLAGLTVLEINCKRLTSPSESGQLKAVIGAGVNFNEKKTDAGYEIIYSTEISFEENEEPKLCSFKYAAKAVYQIDCPEDCIKKAFEETYPYFMRELYNLTREHINETLQKSRVKFALPIGMPDDFKRLNLEQKDDDE